MSHFLELSNWRNLIISRWREIKVG